MKISGGKHAEQLQTPKNQQRMEGQLATPLLGMNYNYVYGRQFQHVSTPPPLPYLFLKQIVEKHRLQTLSSQKNASSILSHMESHTDTQTIHQPSPSSKSSS
eukprot:TRINITY_DN6143_c0_g2_i1.p2 TRINITY_DN6143_c0_g2~~TRINITY_DN6143_c0_g2_i1.p2  ORF type:complete len:102 (+),score=15.27 TRINITY_DN6143_c0_g2_i1:402-707(+)